MMQIQNCKRQQRVFLPGCFSICQFFFFKEGVHLRQENNKSLKSIKKRRMGSRKEGCSDSVFGTVGVNAAAEVSARRHLRPRSRWELTFTLTGPLSHLNPDGLP